MLYFTLRVIWQRASDYGLISTDLVENNPIAFPVDYLLEKGNVD